MRPRIINDVFLIVLSVVTFIYLKKAITEFSMASMDFLSKDLLKIPTVLFKPFTGFTTEHDKNEEDKIYWSPSRKISWEDIKGSPDPNSSLGAVTYCSIGYSAKLKNDSLMVTVICFFNRQKSWVKENQKTEALLKHEQGHFDLNEVFTRKFRKQLAEYKFDKSSVKKDIQILYERCWRECYSQQELYDKESENSRNPVKQQEWDKKIEKELRELSTFNTSQVAAAVN